MFKTYAVVISVATLILAAFAISDTRLGHLATSFPGMAGASVGLLVAGAKSAFFDA